jgi:hypothetical protein
MIHAEQVLDVEKYKAELYESLELYKFTLRLIMIDVQKALRGQSNLGPQRILHLFKDTIGKPNANAIDKTTEQRTASIST